MATQRQIEANRRNAKLSTGPKSAEGKARSSQNRLVHGFSARTIAVEPRRSQQFLELRNHWLAQYPHADEMQRETIGQIAVTLWHLGRLAELEADYLHRQEQTLELAQRRKLETLLAIDAERLDRLHATGVSLMPQLLASQQQPVAEVPVVGLPPEQYQRYEGSLERTLHRLFRKMRRLQREQVRAAKNLQRVRSQIAAGDVKTKGFGANEANRFASSSNALPVPASGEKALSGSQNATVAVVTSTACGILKRVRTQIAAGDVETKGFGANETDRLLVPVDSQNREPLEDALRSPLPRYSGGEG